MNGYKMEQFLSIYYKDKAKKLHTVIDQIFHRYYGGTGGKDMEEFYGIGTDVLTDIFLNDTYEPSKGDFDGYVYRALRFAMADEWKKRYRDKRVAKIETFDEEGKLRKIPLFDLSLDAPAMDGEMVTIGDMIPSDFHMDDVLSERMGNSYDGKVGEFFSHLSEVQRQIVEMKMEEIPVWEIKKKLGLSNKQYNRHWKEIKSFANISILFCNESGTKPEKEDMEMGTTTQTMENCKTDKISIASIIKKIDRHTIRFDHPLQRESDQWSPSMKGNLVSDILQGNKLHPLIFAEQVINGVPIIWDLDGKQRCTNAYTFSKNGYKVSKTIRRWMIKYQTIAKDENGNDILDENGFPVAVNAEFDIRGKKFSDLPEELKDRFLDYSFNYEIGRAVV